MLHTPSCVASGGEGDVPYGKSGLRADGVDAAEAENEVRAHRDDGAHYNAYMQQNAGTKVFKYPRQISELPMVFETFVMQGLDTDQDDSLGCAHVFELQRRARRPDDGLLRCHVANNFYKCYLCWQSQARDKIFKQRLPTLLKGRIHPSLHPAAANKRHPRCWERLLCLYFKGVFGRWLPG